MLNQARSASHIISHACLGPGFKAEFYLKAVVCLSGYYGSNANISFTFQAVKNLSQLISHNYVLGCFVNSGGGGGGWVYLRINSSFLKAGIRKIYGNGKFGRFDVVLNLEFEF